MDLIEELSALLSDHDYEERTSEQKAEGGWARSPKKARNS